MAKRTEWALTTTTFPELEEERELADQVRAERPNLETATNEVLIARARSMAPLQRLVWGRSYCIASNQAVDRARASSPRSSARPTRR